MTHETLGTELLTCPWCGHEHDAFCEDGGTLATCDNCGRTFTVDVETTRTYSTRKLGEEVIHE